MGVISVLTLVAAMLATGAASRYTGMPVTQVDFAFEGAGSLPETARSLVGINSGDPYDPEAIRRSIKQLFALGAFSDIKVEADNGDDGVALTFRLYPALTFGEVTITGLDESSKELIRFRDSLLKGSEIRSGRLFDAELVDGLVGQVEDGLVQSGFHWGKVEPEVQFEGSSAIVRLHVYPGPQARLRGLRVQGVPPHVENSMRSKLPSRDGLPYSSSSFEQDVDKLVADWKAAGFYEADVEIREAFDPPDSVRIDLNVVLGPQVLLEVEGAELSDREKSRLIPVLRETSISEDLLEESKANIEEYFQENGYRDVTVTLERSILDEGRRLELRFHIALGSRFYVGDTRIEGLSSIDSSQVLAIMVTRPGRLRARAFSPLEWEEDLDEIRRYLRRQGLHRVSVYGEVHPRDDAPQEVDLVVRVIEGPRALIESVEIVGSDQLPSVEALSASELVVGSPFHAPQIAEARERILDKYRNRGYQQADVEAQTRLDETGTQASVGFHINEGEQTFIGKVIVSGLEVTREEALRREITVQPSEPLSTEALLETRQRLVGTGLFREVSVEVLEHEAASRFRDVLIRLEEGPRTSLGYGFGYNERTLARAEVEVTRRNLFGLNRTLSVFARASLRGGRFVTTYRQPTFFGLALPVFLSAFHEEEYRASFDYIRKGVGFQVSKKVSENRSYFFRYNFNRTDVTRLDVPVEEVPREFRDIRLSTVSVSQVTDTRNDVISPKSGQARFLDLEFSLKAIGSKSPYIKGFAQQFFYLRLPKRMVGVIGMRLGIGQTFRQDRDALLPITERFFAGGANTLRGFGLDQASPKDSFGNPVGGNILTLLNLELRFPLVGKLGGVIFSDNGTVYRRLKVIELLKWRYNVGFGVRYDTPLGPLRVDWGFKIDIRPGEPPSRIHVSLGHAF
jgi:outer membrane protein assembly complex protein YaeT